MNTLKNLFLFIASCLNTALSDIATIKSKVADSGVVTINGNFCKYVKKNGYVFVFGDSPVSGDDITVGSEYKTVGTLPVALRPSKSVYFIPTSKGVWANLIGLINTDGSVSLQSTNATRYWAYSVMFPIEDAYSQAYAVYDSTDQSMTFFRDDKGKYTDGQVSGTKTYYAGFEDITGVTDPSWYNSSSDNQKNTIKTVTFKDKIKPKTCYDWFSNARSLASITGLDKLDTTAVKDMRYMFYRCSSLTSLNLSSFNTAKVTNMNWMFKDCSRLKTIYASSLFTTNAVTVGSSNSMFYGCTSLVGGAGTEYNEINVDQTYARIDGGASNPGYFTAKMRK